MFSKLLKRTSGARRSLRFRIAVSAIAAVAASSLIADAIIYLSTAQQIRQEAETNLVLTNALLATETSRTMDELLASLELLALSPSFRNLRIDEITEIINQQRSRHPTRSTSVWSSDGQLLVGEPPSSRGSRNPTIFQSTAFQEALRGQSSLQVLPSSPQQRGCILGASGIFPPGAQTTPNPNLTAQAVLTFCMPFTVTELSLKMLASIDRLGSSGRGPKANGTISMQRKVYGGKEFMLVHGSGAVIFPLSHINDSVSQQTPEEISRGPWGPFVRLALSNRPNDQVLNIKVAGTDYLVVKRLTAHRKWIVLSIIASDSAMQVLNEDLWRLRLLQLITLVVVTSVLYRLSGDIARPIHEASAAIRRLSNGDFSIQIKHNRHDELGDLYDDINTTGALLSCYVKSQKTLAAAEQQLATAKQIQQSFLLRKLPESKAFELAADFLPAYEIGADWYDALLVERFLYVIIADVCDKGVPSALFMSVFRTLLRSNILSEARDCAPDQAVDLPKVVTLVNEYMAANHGDDTMFATMFVASYDTQTGTLRYVNAGHELPLVLRADSVEAQLEALDPTGPAVGLFPGTEFLAGESRLAPGDLLFSYTDGLTDARSPEQQGWGGQRLREFLLQLPPQARQPRSVLQQLLTRIEEYQGDADRFDDLTVLTLRISPPQASGESPQPA